MANIGNRGCFHHIQMFSNITDSNHSFRTNCLIPFLLINLQKSANPLGILESRIILKQTNTVAHQLKLLLVRSIYVISQRQFDNLKENRIFAPWSARPLSSVSDFPLFNDRGSAICSVDPNHHWDVEKNGSTKKVGNWTPTLQILMCECANVLGYQFAQLFASEQNFVGH